jgi:hypothetical protein
VRASNEQRARQRVGALVFLVLAALAVLALSRWFVGPASGWLALNLSLIVVFLEVVTLPHELGHALAAHALGFRVYSVTAGVGPRLVERTVRGVRFRVHAYPFGGYTVYAPRERRFFRLRHFLAVAAGPAVNGLFVAGAVLLSRDLDVTSVRSEPRPALAFLAANALILVLNLLPRMHTSAAGLGPNDGMQLLKVPFAPESGVTELLAARYCFEAQLCRERESLLEARAWAERGLEALPGAPLLHFDLGFTLVLLGDCEGARREFLVAAEAPDVAPAFRAGVLNNIAWVDVVTGPNDRLDEADLMSQEALRTLGFSPAHKGTRGAVLIAMGRAEEGLVLLRDALLKTREDELHPMARASYSCAMILGLVAQGRLAEAAELLPAARGYHGRSPLLGRAEAAMAGTVPTASPPGGDATGA